MTALPRQAATEVEALALSEAAFLRLAPARADAEAPLVERRAPPVTAIPWPNEAPEAPVEGWKVASRLLRAPGALLCGHIAVARATPGGEEPPPAVACMVDAVVGALAAALREAALPWRCAHHVRFFAVAGGRGGAELREVHDAATFAFAAAGCRRHELPAVTVCPAEALLDGDSPAAMLAYISVSDARRVEADVFNLGG